MTYQIETICFHYRNKLFLLRKLFVSILETVVKQNQKHS